MKLRYLQTYDKNGVQSEPELQYWDKEGNWWEPVPFVKVKETLEQEYMMKEDERGL